MLGKVAQKVDRRKDALRGIPNFQYLSATRTRLMKESLKYSVEEDKLSDLRSSSCQTQLESVPGIIVINMLIASG